MRRAVRFLIALVAGLALLAFAGDVVLSRTAGLWFERDVVSRSRLAVNSAQKALVSSWVDPQALTEVLDDLTHDERIMGATACAPGPSHSTIAKTAEYPVAFSCPVILDRLRNAGLSSNGTRGMTLDLATGPVHFTATELDGETGTVILVHDMSGLQLRTADTRNVLLVGFFVLAIGASIVTLVAIRVAWRGWTTDLRAALTGDAPLAFRPLLRDVRELVERLTKERENESPTQGSGPWSAARLKSTLLQHLQGERVVLLANREPYIHEKTADGGVKVTHPASGLVTALEPVMKACSGVWVGHGSGSADKETVDSHDRVRVPPGEESYAIRRVWLTPEEEKGYYYGFANEGLWPLCHVAHTRPNFRSEDWAYYQAVNRRFADAVCQEVDSDDPIVLVQDYHFALAPRMIRDRLPKATILTFWHIPWPNPERISICPYAEELISGLLGSSIVGFHTQQHCNNFIDSVDASIESRIDRERNAVVLNSRSTLVRPYPISIEWPVHWLEGAPSIAECRAEIRKELGLAPDALLGVGIDRLDYTKGIEERLMAVDEMLLRHPELRGRFTFAQLAAPSRTKIERYQQLNEQVEKVAAEINAKWGSGSYRPIALLRAHHEPPQVFKYYRAAELCYVSSLHDGMNLVAKEFVAAHTDEQGVLILSQFTGAARDLTGALIVNPYDIREASEAMASALRMMPSEQRERMQSMRRMVSEFNVYRWAGRMLVDAAEVRRRERMTGRWSATQALRRFV